MLELKPDMPFSKPTADFDLSDSREDTVISHWRPYPTDLATEERPQQAPVAPKYIRSGGGRDGMDLENFPRFARVHQPRTTLQTGCPLH
jgi:hypothetical protein